MVHNTQCKQLNGSLSELPILALTVLQNPRQSLATFQEKFCQNLVNIISKSWLKYCQITGNAFPKICHCQI